MAVAESSAGVSSPVRFALGLIEPHGERWLVAQTWESESLVREWIDSIPEEVEVSGKKASGCRAWMSKVELMIVPVETRCLPPVPLLEGL